METSAKGNTGLIYIFTGDGPKVHLLRLVVYVHAAEGRDFGVNKT